MLLAAGVASAQTKGVPSSGKKSTVKTASSKKKSSARPGTRKTASRRGRGRKGSWKHKGQQKIDEARVRQIQEALIREKYLDGEPSGKWDTRTEQAMGRYQSDQGWQSKITPDSRALIKLGLGPDHSQDTIIVPDKKTSMASPAGTRAPAATSSSNRNF